VLSVPRLDLEPVHKASAEIAYHGVIRGAVEISVVLEAVEQNVESLAEVARTEVVVARLRDGLLEELLGRGVATHVIRSGK
jgi:hypothetical protein